jgi:hypothetical protein
MKQPDSYTLCWNTVNTETLEDEEHFVSINPTYEGAKQSAIDHSNGKVDEDYPDDEHYYKFDQSRVTVDGIHRTIHMSIQFFFVYDDAWCYTVNYCIHYLVKE